MQPRGHFKQKQAWRRAILGGGMTLIVLSLFFVKAESLPATTTDSSNIVRTTPQPLTQNIIGDASTTPTSPIVGNQNETIQCPQDASNNNSYVYTVTQASAPEYPNGGIQYGSDVESSKCSWLSCENYWLTYGKAAHWLTAPSTYSITCVTRPGAVTYSGQKINNGSGGTPVTPP
jgi:hypothetical protein